MSKKKRTTNKNQEPKGEESPVLPEDAQEQALAEEVKETPEPATEGELQPPQPPKGVWVYVAIFAAVLGTVVLLILYFNSRQITPVEPIQFVIETEEVVEVAELPLEDLSYLSVVSTSNQSVYYEGTQDECLLPTVDTEDDGLAEADRLAPNLTRPSIVNEKTYFTVRVLAGGQGYESQDDFFLDFEHMNRIVQVANSLGIRLTIHLAKDFADMATSTGMEAVFVWASTGHDVGLYFDEEEQLGVTSFEEADDVPYGTWLSAIHDLQIEVQELCGCQVTSFSGGGSFSRLYDVGNELGMVAHSNWSNYDFDEAPAQFLVSWS